MRRLLFLLSFIGALRCIYSSSTLVNVTVDDSESEDNSSTGDRIIYGRINDIRSGGGWNIGQDCPGCLAQPDPAQVFNGTWHDTATQGNGKNLSYATLTFTGKQDLDKKSTSFVKCSPSNQELRFTCWVSLCRAHHPPYSPRTTPKYFSKSTIRMRDPFCTMQQSAPRLFTHTTRCFSRKKAYPITSTTSRCCVETAVWWILCVSWTESSIRKWHVK